MDKQLTQLKNLLEGTIAKVETIAAKNDHDAFNELIEQVADERDAILKEVSPTDSEREKYRQEMNEIIELDQQLNRMIEKYFESFKREIVLLKKKKDSNVKYTNPYKHMKSPDGAFLDKRK